MRKRSGHIYKRKNVYWLRYQVDGKRISQSLHTRNRREAQTAAERILAPLRVADKAEALKTIKNRLGEAEENLEALTREARPALEIDRAWHRYLSSQTRPQSGPRTLRDYQSQYNTFTRWLSAAYPEIETLDGVTELVAEDFVGHLVSKGFSGNRINKYIRFLRTFFKVLARQGRLTDNPFQNLAYRRQTPESKRPLTIEELRVLIESAEGEFQTLFLLGTFTGLRLADAATLLWSEVDLDLQVIRRIPRKTARTGKPVSIGIPEILLAKLRDIKGSGPYVLPKLGRLYNRDAPRLSKLIQQHFERCGITTTKPGTGTPSKRAVTLVGFHSLRHTFVTLHAQAGTPPAIIQKLAGHANPTMTEHYTHLTDESAAAIARSLPRTLRLEEQDSSRPHNEPIPAWAVKELQKMNAKNWKRLRSILLEYAPA